MKNIIKTGGLIYGFLLMLGYNVITLSSNKIESDQKELSNLTAALQTCTKEGARATIIKKFLGDHKVDRSTLTWLLTTAITYSWPAVLKTLLDAPQKIEVATISITIENNKLNPFQLSLILATGFLPSPPGKDNRTRDFSCDYEIIRRLLEKRPQWAQKKLPPKFYKKCFKFPTDLVSKSPLTASQKDKLQKLLEDAANKVSQNAFPAQHSRKVKPKHAEASPGSKDNSPPSAPGCAARPSSLSPVQAATPTTDIPHAGENSASASHKDNQPLHTDPPSNLASSNDPLSPPPHPTSEDEQPQNAHAGENLLSTSRKGKQPLHPDPPSNLASSNDPLSPPPNPPPVNEDSSGRARLVQNAHAAENLLSTLRKDNPLLHIDLPSNLASSNDLLSPPLNSTSEEEQPQNARANEDGSRHNKRRQDNTNPGRPPQSSVQPTIPAPVNVSGPQLPQQTASFFARFCTKETAYKFFLSASTAFFVTAAIWGALKICNTDLSRLFSKQSGY